MKNNATAVWQGTGKEGSGKLSTKSGVLSNAVYSYKSRFEGDSNTNPEELIAAAHAGCFTMKLSFLLVEAGFTADTLTTNCENIFEKGAVTNSNLTVKGKVPGISKEKFNELAQDAGKNCPISKLLNTEISVNAELQ
jgi:osmotically inducible protein OsmC